MESHTMLMEQPYTPLKWTQENHPQNASQLEHIKMNPLPTTMTGVSESNQILTSSDLLSPRKNEINSANQSLNLKSNVKPHVLLERIFEPKVLRVNKEDFSELCQVIIEFQEQI